MTTEGRSAERSSLPVLWEPPAGRASGGKEPYVPRHALRPQRRFDRTNLWIWLLLFLTSSFVVGTTAVFNATIGDSGNAFGSASLGVPGAQSLTLSGTNLTASVATFGGFDGSGGTVGVRWRYYHPTGVSSDGSAPTCASGNSAYPSTQDIGSSQTTSRTVSMAGFAPGRWACVMAFTTYPAVEPVAPAVQWLSQAGNPRGAFQAGYVVQRVVLANGAGGTAGLMENGDSITITFNQAVDPSNGRPTSGYVCLPTGAANYIFVGASSACGTNYPNPVTMIGLEPKLNVTATVATTLNFGPGGWLWTDDRTLTITLSNGSGNTSGKGNKAVDANNAPIGGTGCTSASTTCFMANTSITGGTTTTADGDAGATLRSAGQPYATLCKAQPVGAPDAGICFPDASGRF